MGVYLGSKAVSVYNGGQMAPEEKTVTAGTSPIEVNATSGKLMSKVTVNPTPTEEKTVTPTTENLIVAPVEGKQLSQVTVQGDANFIEENIAEGITIWGKTGTHQGGVSGQYVWSKQFAGSTATEDTAGGTYTLTTVSDSIPSSEIEYSSSAPTYNTETRKWEMANSTVVTITNADTTVPTFSGNMYVIVKSDPNVWYLATAIRTGGTGPYTKGLDYSAKYTAAIDNSYVEYVTGETADAYPNGGWVDVAYYKRYINVKTCTLRVADGSHGAIYCTVYSNGNIEYKKVEVSDNRNHIDNIVVGSIVSLRAIGAEGYVCSDPATSSENFVYLAPGLFQITGDAESGMIACFAKGTKITTKHGGYKFVENITYDDELLVWDFDNACFTYAKPCWIKKAETTNYYYQCTFENGDILKVVGSNDRSHRIFSFDDNKFLSATDCVGKMVMNKDGTTKMLSCEKIEETVEFYNIITERHMNLFAENMLTSCRLNNLYPIQDMKFVKDDKLTIPIERYSPVTQKYYDSLRLGERDIEDIEWINSYVERIDNIAKAHNKDNL